MVDFFVFIFTVCAALLCLYAVVKMVRSPPAPKRDPRDTGGTYVGDDYIWGAVVRDGTIFTVEAESEKDAISQLIESSP